MIEENIEVTVFLKNGKALRFRQAENFCEDEEGWIGFVYQGVPTDKERVAVFYINNIAGYSIDSKGVEGDMDGKGTK